MYVQALSIEYTLEKPRPELGDIHFSPLFHRVSAICPVLHIFGKAHVPPVPCSSGQSPSHSVHVDLPHHTALSHGSEKSSFAKLSAEGCSRSDLHDADAASPAGHVPLSHTDLSPLPMKPSVANSAGHEADTTPPIAPGHNINHPPNITTTTHPVLQASHETHAETAAWSTYSVCLHVHGCYPYFMVPQYDPSITATQFGAQLEAVALQVLHQQQRAAQYNNSNASRPATSFRAVTVTVGDNDNEGATTQPESRWGNRYNSADNTYGYGSHYYGWRDRRTPQLVHDVELIERMPFYGYHAEPCAFFKVHVIDPSRMQWLMSLLHDTSYIGGRHWRLFEGHNKFHSQFMVDYDLSGIAPVMLRRGCHVRQPTVPEFSPAGEANEYDDEEYNYGREGGDDEDYVPTEEERKKAEELRRMREEQRLAYARMLATHYGIDQVHPADDPPRESTCELELDVAAHVLTTDTTTTTTTTTSNSNSKEKYARVREPGANLAHLRRLIQRYFAEHGVDDALRVAKTMAVEEEELEAWKRGGGVAMPMTMMDNSTTSAVKAADNAESGVKNKTSEEAERARDKKTAAPAKTEEAALRYGSVIQIQRNDAMLTAMREKMVEFVQARPASEIISTEDAYCHTRHHKEGLQAGLPVDMTQRSAHYESGHTQELFDALAVPLAQRQQLLSLSQRVLAPLSFSTNSSLEEPHNSTLAIEAVQAKTEADTTPKDVHATQTTALLLGEELPDVPPHSTTANVVESVKEVSAVPYTSADAMQHTHEDADDEDEILLLSDDTYHDHKVSPKHTPHTHTTHKHVAYAEDDSDPPPLFSSTPTIPTSSYSPQRHSPSVTPQTTQRTTHSPLPPLPIHHVTPVEEEDEEVVLLRSTSPSPTQQRSSAASRQASAHSAHTIIQSDNNEAWLVSDTKSRSDTEDEAKGGEAVVETPVICPSVQILSAPSPQHQQGSVVDVTSIGSPVKELPQVKDEEEVLDCDAVTCSIVTVHSPSSQGVTSGPSLNAVQAALLRELRQGSLVRLTSTLLSELVPELPRVTFTLRYKANMIGETAAAVGMICVDVAPPWAMQNSTQTTSCASIPNKETQKTIQAYVNEQDNMATTTAANDNSVAECQRRSVPLMTCVRRGSAGSGSAEVAALPVIDRRARLKRLAAGHNKAGEEEDDDVDRVVLAENHVNVKGDEAEELAESSPRFSAGREHALQCVLRVMCVEVLVRRRCNVQLLSADPLRAIALGTTTSSSDDVSITIYCVKVNAQQGSARSYELSAHVQIVELDSEAEMLQQACEAILRADPDLLLSWEGYKYGIGLFSLRYGIVLHRSLARDLSRLHRGNPYCPPQPQNNTTNTSNTNATHFNSVYRRRAAFMQHVSARNNNTNLTGYAMRPTTFTRLSAQDHYERAKRAAHYTVRIPMQTSRRLRRLQRKRAEASKGTTGALDKVKTRNNPRRRFFAVAAAAAAAAAGGVGNVEGQANFVAEGVGLTMEGEEEGNKAVTGEANRTTAQVQHAAENHKDDNKDDEEEEDIATRTARQYAKRFGANVRIAGRVCVSLSKSIRKEVKLPSYSLTMAYQSLLKATLPYFADTVLAAMYDGRQSVADTNEEEQPAASVAALHAMALHYLVSRVIAPHRIARHLHHYARTMEYSRMFGILFEEVMTRGSQFRVEATLRRMTGPQGYVMLSPSRAMVYRQPRIQCIPLIMQPLCDFYHDPVVVLDFRSLYPSMIIAYNLCYSTCVGMVQPDTCSRLGVLPDYVQDNALLAELVPDDGDGFDHVTLTPNGAMFVKPSTRIGVLPEMIRTVLDTRVELQAALQHVAIPTKATETQQRLGEQQQALKMLANVTYGYTGASYTGRMPCVDLAEAIVSLARQTLERAIALVEETTQWRARVIYGDTDSMFVWLPGRTRAEAFTIGAEIARAVTAANPAPVRLQFEKVLQPCFLVVKKRYVGYAWYNASQLEPQYLAKGIETERRDQCAATTKLTRAMIERYFRDKATTSTQTSISKPANVKDGSVKELRAFYVQQVSKLQRGDCNPADCIFRRAVKLGRYKDESHLPLGAHLALQLMERDLANTPFWGERVPYVVVRRLGRQELKQRVVQPEQMLFVNRHLVLDADYYIHRHLNAALDRIFYLVNISCAQWYSELPRRRSSTTGGAQRYAELQGFLQLKARQSIAHPLWWERIAEHDTRSDNTNTSNGVCYAARMQRKRRRSAIEAELRRGYAEDTAIVIDEEVDRVSEGSTVLHEEGNVHTSVDKQSREVVIVVDEDNDDDEEEVKKEEDKKQQQVSETNKESVIQVKHLQQSKLTTLLAAPNTVTGPSDARLNTLDAYYPRVLCVCCEQNIVTLAEQQRDFLAFMVDVSEVRDADRIAAAQLSHSRQGESSREGLMRATSLPALQALAAVPPICASCWASPLQLYSRIMRRYARVTRRLRAAQRACACCMGGCGTVNGPAFFARLVRNDNDASEDEYEENIASVPQRDMEDLASAAPHVAVPRELTGAIAEYDPNEASTHYEMYSELGCSSIDCPISFEKKRLTQLADQLRALQWYLQEVL